MHKRSPGAFMSKRCNANGIRYIDHTYTLRVCACAKPGLSIYQYIIEIMKSIPTFQ